MLRCHLVPFPGSEGDNMIASAALAVCVAALLSGLCAAGKRTNDGRGLYVRC